MISAGEDRQIFRQVNRAPRPWVTDQPYGSWKQQSELFPGLAEPLPRVRGSLICVYIRLSSDVATEWSLGEVVPT